MAKRQEKLFDEEETIVRPVDNPIICNPFEEPLKHFEYDSKSGDPRLNEWRRPASYWFKTKKVYTAQASLFAEEEREDLPLINLLREDVRKWRDSGYELATPITKKLLLHWQHPNRERKLFFCQRESVETIIYINEVLATGRKPRWKTQLSYDDFQKLMVGETPSFVQVTDSNKDLLPRLIDTPNENNSLPLIRYGCKMATGSGKTVVMAMLIAWSFCNRGAQPSDTRFPDAALILCPNLTIKDRLKVLRPDVEGNYYERFDLIPSTLLPLLNKGKIFITNWHLLNPESPHVESGESYRVVNKGEESNEAFARRILQDLYEHAPVMVLNDEGHHAYRPKQLNESELTEEERKEREEATVWISGVDRINASCGVKFCIDLSATPFYIHGSGYVEGSPFPWLVSDFGLVDAIESGIVKIPRIPVSDITGAPEPKYFALWKYINTDLRAGQKLPGGRPKPEIVWERAEDALQQLAGQYKERFGYYMSGSENQLKIPPVMIIVCDNTNIAQLFYQRISGEHFEEREEKFTRGKRKGEIKIVKEIAFGRGKVFPEIFSNTESSRNTIRIDSKIIQETDAEDLTKDEAKKQLRGIIDSVGQIGKPGEQIKCVVSVQMLTEGWDANNVTHILGLRAFGSQLLVEQVVGRGLRRMSYTVNPETNLLPPEYVDVYGIPFSIIPFKGRPTGKAAPEDKPDNHVRALPERNHLELQFPVVDGYVFDLKNNQIKIDFSELEELEIEPLKNPVQTFIQPQVGYKVGNPGMISGMNVITQDRSEYYANIHLQTIQFEIAMQIVNNLTLGRNELKPKMQHHSRMQLFPQVFQIINRYAEEKIEYHGWNRKEIGLETYSKKIIELLTTAIEPDESEGEPPLLPQMNRYKEKGSTALVNFTTKKKCYATKFSHINQVVADTDRWEQSAAFTLDSIAMSTGEVVSYVKNDHLEFSIPYEFEGEKPYYEPDYIVKLINGVTLILEIKGYEDNKTKAKHQGAKKWISAVNNWGKLGKWDFLVCRNPAHLRTEIIQKVDTTTEAIKEHDIVELTEDLLHVPLFIGNTGTVVHIYPKAKAYAVEFKKKDKSITVETVKPQQIKKR